jgi:hypothetical protein
MILIPQIYKIKPKYPQLGYYIFIYLYYISEITVKY